MSFVFPHYPRIAIAHHNLVSSIMVEDNDIIHLDVLLVVITLRQVQVGILQRWSEGVSRQDEEDEGSAFLKDYVEVGVPERHRHVENHHYDSCEVYVTDHLTIRNQNFAVIEKVGNNPTKTLFTHVTSLDPVESRM